jgi:hypothetical protein
VEAAAAAAVVVEEEEGAVAVVERAEAAGGAAFSLGSGSLASRADGTGAAWAEWARELRGAHGHLLLYGAV